MTGLLVYLMIGSLIACRQLVNAEKWHEKGILDDEEYITHKYFKSKVFSFITLFWLPAIIQSVSKAKGM